MPWDDPNRANVATGGFYRRIWNLSGRYQIVLIGLSIVGGWLVIKGETDVGTVVAALSGLARIARPWNDLITFYRTLSAVRVRFELLEETMR